MQGIHENTLPKPESSQTKKSLATPSEIKVYIYIHVQDKRQQTLKKTKQNKTKKTKQNKTKQGTTIEKMKVK